MSDVPNVADILSSLYPPPFPWLVLGRAHGASQSSDEFFPAAQVDEFRRLELIYRQDLELPNLVRVRCAACGVIVAEANDLLDNGAPVDLDGRRVGALLLAAIEGATRKQDVRARSPRVRQWAGPVYQLLPERPSIAAVPNTLPLWCLTHKRLSITRDRILRAAGKARHGGKVATIRA